MSLQDYQNNVLAMLDLAQANGIKVVLAGIPPASGPAWGNNDPGARIGEINTWLRRTAEQRKCVFVDYRNVLADPEGHIKEALSNDGTHPNRAGYALMRPLAEQAIARALGAR
jgi:lysophospholipase L1-like esterase